MGYERVITYTLKEESGASLKAVGARVVGEVEPQEWAVPSPPRKSQPVYGKAGFVRGDVPTEFLLETCGRRPVCGVDC
jgi:hypothetical protein